MAYLTHAAALADTAVEEDKSDRRLPDADAWLAMVPANGPAPPFTALEWLVVALARRDGLSSIATPGRMATALGTLFGRGHNPQLADPRLEALRRLTVLAHHHHGHVPAHEIAAFRNAGFNAAQLAALLPHARQPQQAAS